jgi:hypothetical protein
MPENSEQKQLPARVSTLGPWRFLFEVLQGVGVALGLALLWMLESIRNVVFRALDRFNVKARPHRHVSAFPPGSPRRRNPA